MAEAQLVRRYAGKSGKECYQAALQALAAAGFKIWKQRDYGWFVIARRAVSGGEVTANILASPVPPASLNINLTAHGLSEAELQPFQDDLLARLDQLLG